MAVVSVLWSLALLASIAVSVLFAGNVSYRLASNNLQIAVEDTIAEAAVNRAVLALLDPRLENGWRVDGVPHEFAFDGIHARIFIQDELGRIDLNHADGSVLAALFESAGLDALSASSLTNKILDWRDQNPLRHVNGAKDQDYRAAGLTYSPRDGPFQSVDELKLVIGVTPEIYKRVAPALTVYSGHPFIDPQVAPPEALLAIPGMDAGKVASIISARTQQAYGGNNALAASADGLADPINALKGRAFTIRAELAMPNGIVARETAIRLTGDPRRPYWVLNWVRQ
jgi:general secretion pathway protein K